MDDLGLLEEFLALPHQRVEPPEANVYGEAVTIADFAPPDAALPYLVLMPQWDFLDFLARARRARIRIPAAMGTRGDRR